MRFVLGVPFFAAGRVSFFAPGAGQQLDFGVPVTAAVEWVPGVAPPPTGPRGGPRVSSGLWMLGAAGGAVPFLALRRGKHGAAPRRPGAGRRRGSCRCSVD